MNLVGRPSALGMRALALLATWLSLASGLATHAHSAPVRPSCPACVAIASELEYMMRSEWAHLQMTVRDRKRVLAADAVANQACDEAVEAMLKQICSEIDGYGIGYTNDGRMFYRRVRGVGSIFVGGGSLSIGASASLEGYCREVIGAHEDALAKIMADGTDDLVNDLCVTTAHECTPTDVANLPPESLPRHRVPSS